MTESVATHLASTDDEMLLKTINPTMLTFSYVAGRVLISSAAAATNH